MKNTQTLNSKGASTCPTSEERYTYFKLTPRPRAKGTYCQYDFRGKDGKLFSCVAPTLDKCREKRDRWIELTTASTHQCKYYTPPEYGVCSTCQIGGYCNRVCDKFEKK
ncbi:MAG: DUF3873 family protein [Rikenellaceae bacterium]